jgi:hypothetical protein
MMGAVGRANPARNDSTDGSQISAGARVTRSCPSDPNGGLHAQLHRGTAFPYRQRTCAGPIRGRKIGRSRRKPKEQEGAQRDRASPSCQRACRGCRVDSAPRVRAALRHSPLVGADLRLARSHEAGRKVDV